MHDVQGQFVTIKLSRLAFALYSFASHVARKPVRKGIQKPGPQMDSSSYIAVL